MQVSVAKRFRRAICRVIGHDYNKEFVCTRCKRICRYEDIPPNRLDEGIPNGIVMDYLRRKYIDMLPPAQKDIQTGRYYLDE